MPIMAQKRALLFDDPDSEIEDGDSGPKGQPIAGHHQSETSFHVNEDYAKRFEHNKKREELHRLEEKYGKVALNSRRAESETSSSEAESEGSSSSDEDEQGELVTDTIDHEISATLAAIRNKDPRLYNPQEVFFSLGEHGDGGGGGENIGELSAKEKSMSLKQYHQTNLLSGYTGDDGSDRQGRPGNQLKSYEKEQEDLRREIVGAMSKAIPVDEMDVEEDLFQPKEKVDSNEQKSRAQESEGTPATLPSNAEADPERFLSAFFSTRAWVPKDTTRPAAFESDDSDDEKAASDFENAYNMRFEEPSLAQRSVITTHSRDVTNKLTLRREEKNKRKKARDAKKDKKEVIVQSQKAEQKRLRKLKIEQLEDKFNKLKEAGGLNLLGDELDDNWVSFLEQEWNGADDWDTNMDRFFGADYYGRKEGELGGKIKKPTWDHEIDIKDIAADFEEDGAGESGDISATEEDMTNYDDHASLDAQETGALVKSKKQPKRRPTTSKLRTDIESFVDDHISVMNLRNASKHPSTFRYRAVSPQSFHLSSSDILFASDKQLNEYAGLKKLASFRDEKKKARDAKRYSKGNQYRLREWRKEVFKDGLPALAKGSLETGAVDRMAEIKLRGPKIDGVDPETKGGSGSKRPKKRRRRSKSSTRVV